MFPRNSLRTALALAGLAAVGASAGSASAATTQTFGCRASVARVSALSSALVVEPWVANANASVCASATAGVTSATPLSTGSLSLGGPLTVGPAEATTTSTTATNLAANSTVSVSGLSIPTAAGAITIAGPVQTTAGYQCVNGVAQATASSTLSALQIGSTQIALSSPGASQTIPLYGALNLQIGTVSVNNNVSTATSNTEQLLNVQLNGLADIVVGEAQVTQPASGACPTAAPNPPSGNPDPAPPSSDPISPNPTPSPTPPTNGKNGTNGKDGSGSGSSSGSSSSSSSSSSAGVSDAIRGDVSGGQVITLRRARRLFRGRNGSACLRGGGAKYVVVGTNRANHITVRNMAFRILGRGGNDTITVKSGRGTTCIDGGPGKDTITNLGRNRVIVVGGPGNDRIRIGNGPASIYGGAGNNTITAGTGVVRIVVGKGHNRIVARGTHDHITAAHNGRTVAYLPRAAAPYARAHGVTHIHVI